MPPPSKRARQCKQAAAKRLKGKSTAVAQSDSASPVFSTHEPQSDHSATESRVLSATELTGASVTGSESYSSEGNRSASETEIPYPIGQPFGGWDEAERKLLGYEPYSESSNRSSKQSRYYHNKKKEKEAADIAQDKATYGSITRFFKPLTNDQPALVPSYIAPDLSEPFLQAPQHSFESELLELNVWAKTASPTGDWLKRVDGLRDLLKIQQRNADREAGPKQDWVKKSLVIAERLGKGEKFARALRKWEENWHTSRIPPPEPRRGKHIKVHSLFEDEGVCTQEPFKS